MSTTSQRAAGSRAPPMRRRRQRFTAMRAGARGRDVCRDGWRRDVRRSNCCPGTPRRCGKQAVHRAIVAHEQGGGRPYVAFSAACPGARGPTGPAISLRSSRDGGARECGVCHFGVGDVGKAPAASTSIDNGFEYHLREFTLALRDYAEARQRELDEQARAMGEAEVASGDSRRRSRVVRQAPPYRSPGRNGCIAVVVSGKAEAPSSLDTPFASTGAVAERGAVSRGMPRAGWLGRWRERPIGVFQLPGGSGGRQRAHRADRFRHGRVG